MQQKLKFCNYNNEFIFCIVRTRKEKKSFWNKANFQFLVFDPRDKKNVLNVCIKLFSSFSDSQIFRPWQQNILFCFKLMGREIRYFLRFSPIYHIYEVSKIRKTKKYFLSSTRKQKDEKLNPDLIVNKAFKKSFKSKY